MRKKTLRTKVMCALLSLAFLASSLVIPSAEAKVTTQTIPVTIGGKTYQITPGQNVTVNTPGGTTTYNVRFVDGKPVALDMTQHTSLIFGEAAGSGSTNTGSTTGATTSKPTNGTNGASTSGNVGNGNSSSASQSTGATNSGNATQSSSSSSTSSSASQSSTPAASTSSTNSGNMTWNEFQKANAGKGMSSSEMSQAWKDYKAGNTGSTSSSAAQSGSSSSSSAAQTSGSNSGSSSPAPQASVAEGATTSNSGSTQGTSSSWDPTKHPRDPQTGQFITHEEAIARGLMDPADANVSTNGSSSQAAQSGEATQSQTTGGSSSETTQASTETAQASSEGNQSGSSNGGESGTAAQAAQTSAEAGQASGGKTKTTIGDKFKAGYAKGKELTNAGFQNVKDSLKSGFSAKNILVTAGITVGVDLATQIMRGEDPSLKSALKTVCCAEFVGGVTGSVLGAATGSFFVPFLSCIPVVGGALSALAPTFGSVVGSSVGAYLAGDLKNGRFSIKEAFKRIDWVGVTGQAIGSTVGAALGSCLGPVGTVLGGMAGGYLGNWAAQKIAGMFGKGEANLPTITMPTGENSNGSVTTAGTITLGGDDVTSVVITDAVIPETDDENNNNNDNRKVVEAGDIDAQITAAYEEYTMYYEEYSNLIQAGKQAEAIEVAQKMNQAKAKYDSLRYED